MCRIHMDVPGHNRSIDPQMAHNPFSVIGRCHQLSESRNLALSICAR